MSTKFTPGRWYVFDWPANRQCVVVDFPQYETPVTLAEVFSMRVNGQKQANAALIADAPAMYALLRRIVEAASCPDALDKPINDAEALLARHES